MSVLSITDLTRDCRALILSHLNNRDFGLARRASKVFHVTDVPELLMRKLRDYSLCVCPETNQGPYCHAAENGWTDLADFFYKSEVPLTISTCDYIAVAFKYGHLSMIEWLISHGYKPSYIAFERAIGAGDIPFYERLLRLFPETVGRATYLMIQAIKSGNINTVKYLLSHGFELTANRKHVTGACQSGNLDMIEFVEAHWGSTMIQVVQRELDNEIQKSQDAKMKARRKREQLTYLQNTFKLQVVEDVATSYRKKGNRIAILDKLYEQGFFDGDIKQSRVITDIFDEDNTDILPWFKKKGWLPTEIHCPNHLSPSDVYAADESKDKLLFNWLVANNIKVFFKEVEISPFELKAALDRPYV